MPPKHVRPPWLIDFGNIAISYLRNTTWEQFAETYLGASALYDNGKEKEAQRLVDQARSNFPLANMRPRDGEERSTQILQMLNSRRYPKDVRNEVGLAYRQKYSRR